MDVAEPAPWKPYLRPGEREAQHPTGATVHSGLIYSLPNGYRPLELDVFVPATAGPVPCVVWIHGGAWLFGSRQQLPLEWRAGSLFQAIVDAGFAVATIDYRHSREAAFPAQLHDAAAALRYLAHFAPELGLDPERFALWGESAGGHLAALLALVTDPELLGTDGVPAALPAVRAVVDFYGVADVDTMDDPSEAFGPEFVAELQAVATGPAWQPIDVLLEGSPWPNAEGRRLVSPVHHVRADAPPFLLIHGDDDRVVPIEQSEQLQAALQGVGATAEFVRVPGADHVFVGTDPHPQFAAGVAFLQRVL
jgi:acetyl esterase/lipase